MKVSEQLRQMERYGLLQEGTRTSSTPDDGEKPSWWQGSDLEFCEDTGVAYRQAEYPYEYSQGSINLSELQNFAPDDLCALTRVNELPSQWEDLIFVDTETTGLSGGTGTHVFLVGCAYFEGHDLILRQFFLPDPGGEPDFISAVVKFLGQRSHVVTFNGKRFDIPLLSQRCTMNKISGSLEFSGHHDLLYPARYLYRDRLSSCSLSSLEEKVLQVERQDDIPGGEIPERYFLFLRRQKFSLISDILKHNADDLLSSAALMIHLMKTASCSVEKSDAQMSLALGRLSLKADRKKRAIKFLQHAVDCAGGSDFFAAAEELSLIYKREKNWSKAVHLWQQMIARIEGNHHSLGAPIFPYVELAKYCEHHAKCPDNALQHTNEAIQHVKRRQQILEPHNDPKLSRDLEDLQHRRQRLLRKSS